MSNIDVEILEEMDKILDVPARWAKGYFAYNAFGREVGFSSREAVKFCLIGAANLAVERVWERRQDQYGGVYYQLLDQALPASDKDKHPVAFNDDEKTTFRQIKNLIKRAIKLAKAQEVSA